jgi:hypothetical protein
VTLGTRLWLYSACGNWRQCVAGDEVLCASGQYTGMTRDGGYQQFMIARRLRLAASGRSRLSRCSPLMCAGLTVYAGLVHAGSERIIERPQGRRGSRPLPTKRPESVRRILGIPFRRGGPLAMVEAHVRLNAFVAGGVVPENLKKSAGREERSGQVKKQSSSGGSQSPPRRDETVRRYARARPPRRLPTARPSVASPHLAV